MYCFYDQGTDHPSVKSFVGLSVNWSVGVIFENADIFMYHTFSTSNTCFTFSYHSKQSQNIPHLIYQDPLLKGTHNIF